MGSLVAAVGLSMWIPLEPDATSVRRACVPHMSGTSCSVSVDRKRSRILGGAARVTFGDDAAFDVAWQEGRSMTQDQAVRSRRLR